MSTFASLNTATTALAAQRRGLDVTGQNIANVNTAGYSRQRVDMQAMGGSTVPAFHSVSTGTVGGVTADDVTRIRDAFLEGRAQLETGTQARLTAESETLGLIERAFREPGDNGVQSLLSEMWAGWGDVANAPKDEAARSQVLQRTATLVAGVNTAAAALDAQWGRDRENLAVLVTDINGAARQIADLNQAIQRAAQTGSTANELADRRDLLVMQLSDQIGARSRPMADGVVDVVVGGVTLVAGATVTELAVTGSFDPSAVPSDPTAVAVDRPRVVTDPGGSTVGVGGHAEGLVNALNRQIPAYRERLDGLAADLATTLNAAHRAGWDLDGVPGTDLLGSEPPATAVTAANLTVLLTDPRKVAASSVGPTAGAPALDNGNADALSQLRLAATGPDSDYRRMIVDLGVEASVTNRNLEIQSVIVTQVHAAVESVAGVNLDEEMSSMLQYQHAYSAAARMLTAIDETLDVLINRLGVVGR